MTCLHHLFLGVLLPVAAGTCPIGFEPVQGNCTDENECEFDVPICGDNAICHNTLGSYYCQCAPGYRERSGRLNFTQDKSKGCEDINECRQTSDICGPNSECINVPGSYSCTCKEGFMSSNGREVFNASQGVTCVDINECRQTSDICGPNSVCENVAGSYFCICKEGFMSSNGRDYFNASQGVTCVDIDECQMDLEICGQHAKCKNTIGGYNCTCDPGYRLQSELTTVTNSSKQCEEMSNDVVMCKKL
ncbi:adhesion G protein-coupled receptor E2-like isoform X1 [Hoplias malabaricus]|uniref:adhesion G protein-coupled receptor E2-like isoform X1 n=1 Tax=Hoplias malabaricus TaxID=27720 RepID=UPI003461C388